MKNPDKVKMGKKSRASGADFERRTRDDLQSKGWIVDKWSNNLSVFGDKENGCWYYEITPAKHKFRGMGIPMAMGTGFPDFIAFKIGFTKNVGTIDNGLRVDNFYEVIGVEAKSNGILKPEEKEKCKWYLENNIFSKILIASKTKVKNRIVIKYEDFNEKYG